MTMKKSATLAIAIACMALSSGMAHAGGKGKGNGNGNGNGGGNGPQARACSLGTLSSGFVDCAGAFSGNLGGALTAAQIGQINAQFADNGFTYSNTMSYLKSDNAKGDGLFLDNGQDMTLNFNAPQTGSFVIGLKQATSYSFYLINGGVQGLSSISFNSAGVSSVGNGLSHAVFIGTPGVAAAVPEPASYAMLLGGLGLLGCVARRRRTR